SQLNQLQGSMESRLQRLTRACDAYVELGDVREQLLAYADSSATRRAVIEAIMALAEDRRPPPLSEGGANWLEPAMNGVIAAAAGDSDPAAEERATALSRDAVAFHVVLMGALGRGEAVADRVIGLLITDGDFTPLQQTVWEASVAGLYGDLLPSLRPAVERALAAAPTDRLVDGLGFTLPAATLALRWLIVAAETRAATDQPASAGAQGALPVDVEAYPGAGTDQDDVTSPEDRRESSLTALRTLAIQLASAGMPGERDLLARARELRATIESPTDAERAERATEPIPRPVADAVLDAHRSLPPGDPARVELFTWIAPHLDGLVDTLVRKGTPDEVEVLAKTAGGNVAVRPDGMDVAARQKAEQHVEARYGGGAGLKEKVCLGVAGVGVVLAVLCFIVAAPALGVLLLVAAGVAAALGLVAMRERRQAATDRAADLADIGTKLDQASQRVRTLESDRLTRAADLDGLQQQWARVRP
ncbi:MAG: hypothetical protein L0G99_11810, partial [Propionibacteriales bacterium]|nr:hypothetical protein [Propionibacteriales bacterium]